VAHTVLLVPVPALEPWVRSRHLLEGPEWLSPDPGHVHAHVTVLGPFLAEPEIGDDVHATLAEVAAATEPFGFALEEVRTFPSGLIHLHPDPPEPFAALTNALVERFPDHPPYAGEYPAVPHLSLAAHGPGRDAAVVARELSGVLPVRAWADEVALVRYAEHDTRTLCTYPLGRR
jgi:2'-5' RNA ligase